MLKLKVKLGFFLQRRLTLNIAPYTRGARAVGIGIYTNMGKGHELYGPYFTLTFKPYTGFQLGTILSLWKKFTPKINRFSFS